MKKIGLVGGIGPASTVEYYLGLIKKCHMDKGLNIYPEIVIDSVNMTNHDEVIRKKEYEKLCEYLLESLHNLKAAGAEIAAITANTEHIVWNMMSDRFPLPVISIVESVVKDIKKKAYKRILVFGTELPLALKPGDVSVPVLNTTELHINEIYYRAIRCRDRE